MDLAGLSADALRFGASATRDAQGWSVLADHAPRTTGSTARARGAPVAALIAKPLIAGARSSLLLAAAFGLIRDFRTVIPEFRKLLRPRPAMVCLMAPITNRPPVPAKLSTPAVDAPKAAAPAVKAEAPRGWAPASGVAPATASAPARDAEAVATEFFSAFQKQDLAAFEKLYAPGVDFKDPIYELQGRGETLHMWKTLFAAGKGLKLSFKVLESGPDGAKVSWTADYKVFGRPVHNEAVSELKVKDGQIVQQRDSWSWSKWARQALPLGPLVDFQPVKAALRFFMQRA